MAKKLEANPLKDRTIYYYRNDFTVIDGVEIEQTLEDLFRDAWHRLPSTDARTFTLSEGKTTVGKKIGRRLARFRASNKDCTVFSLGLYERGAHANTIPIPSPNEGEAESDTQSPPDKKEFLDGEAFVCMYDNHILIAPSMALRVPTVVESINNILFSGGYQSEAALLSIKQIANIDKVKTIMTEGVKNIKLDASAYLQSLNYIERNTSDYQDMSLPQKLTHYFRSAKKMFEDASEEPEKDGLTTQIVISHDGRSSGEKSDEGKEQVKSLATALTESDVGGYVIMTKSGKTFKANDIVIKNSVKVLKHGKSVNQENMWKRLVEDLERYERTGILEV